MYKKIVTTLASRVARRAYRGIAILFNLAIISNLLIFSILSFDLDQINLIQEDIKKEVVQEEQKKFDENPKEGQKKINEFLSQYIISDLANLTCDYLGYDYIELIAKLNTVDRLYFIRAIYGVTEGPNYHATIYEKLIFRLKFQMSQLELIPLITTYDVILLHCCFSDNTGRTFTQYYEVNEFSSIPLEEIRLEEMGYLFDKDSEAKEVVLYLDKDGTKEVVHRFPVESIDLASYYKNILVIGRSNGDVCIYQINKQDKLKSKLDKFHEEDMFKSSCTIS